MDSSTQYREARDRSYGYRDERDLEGQPVAMTYVPWQKWASPYDTTTALKRGTAFAALDLPFHGREGQR